MESASYQAALLMLEVGIFIASSDGTISPEELAWLEGRIGKWSHLGSELTLRLQQAMYRLSESPPSREAICQKMRLLSAANQERLLSLMTAMAAADGFVAPVEIEAMEKLCEGLGLHYQQVIGRLAKEGGVEPSLEFQMAQLFLRVASAVAYSDACFCE